MANPNKFVGCSPYGSVIPNNVQCYDCVSGKRYCDCFTDKSCCVNNCSAGYCSRIKGYYNPYLGCLGNYPVCSDRCVKKCCKPDRYKKKCYHKPDWCRCKVKCYCEDECGCKYKCYCKPDWCRCKLTCYCEDECRCRRSCKCKKKCDCNECRD